MLWPDTLAKEKKLCTTNQARERMTIKSTRFRIHFCSIACSFMGLLSTPSLWKCGNFHSYKNSTNIKKGVP